MFQSNTVLNISFGTQRIHMATIKHDTLNATLRGVVRGSIAQFRGIKYGRIPERFALPEAVDDWAGRDVECKEYGPRCPQQDFDVGTCCGCRRAWRFQRMRRMNSNVSIWTSRRRQLGIEDTVRCRSWSGFMVSCFRQRFTGLPLTGRRGGSQVMTFCSASSGICGKSSKAKPIVPAWAERKRYYQNSRRLA